jgi:hypothetical protein
VKSEKKRKSVADTPEAVEPAAKKTKKPAKVVEVVVVEDTAAKPGSELALDNFPLEEAIKSLLRSKGIESLFAIQARTLEFGLAGNDVVGRARTGCGKTLAFVLPVVQRLMSIKHNTTARGRAPAVIVLAPTRELAKQACPPTLPVTPLQLLGSCALPPAPSAALEARAMQHMTCTASRRRMVLEPPPAGCLHAAVQPLPC